MSEPLKGGFSSFTSGTQLKPPGTTGTPPPTTNLFGNTASTSGTNAQTTNIPGVFGSGAASGGTGFLGNLGGEATDLAFLVESC